MIGALLAVALIVAVLGAFLGLCRALGAHDERVAQELWLRQMLGQLREPALEDDDEDHGLLVY